MKSKSYGGKGKGTGAKPSSVPGKVQNGIVKVNPNTSRKSGRKGK